MRDEECIAFLQWALPRLGMRWEGFRKVRRQVCRRIARRMKALDLADASSYRSFLQMNPGEWHTLATTCRVTISRFYRDHGIFEHLGAAVLPRLAAAARERGDATLRCWSAGCASGEEPYSLALTWHFATPAEASDMALRILATDIDPHLLRRANEACYAHSSLRELPAPWIERAFTRLDDAGDRYRLNEEWKEDVAFACQDLRSAAPDALFDLILCRNLVFTYFDLDGQERLGARLAGRLHPGGVLVVGCHESVPERVTALEPDAGRRGFYVKR